MRFRPTNKQKQKKVFACNDSLLCVGRWRRTRSYWAKKMYVRFFIVFLSSSDDFSHDCIVQLVVQGENRINDWVGFVANVCGNLS